MISELTEPSQLSFAHIGGEPVLIRFLHHVVRELFSLLAFRLRLRIAAQLTELELVRIPISGSVAAHAAFVSA